MSLSICLFVQCLFFLLPTEGKTRNIQKNVRVIAKHLYTACQTLSHVLYGKGGRRRKKHDCVQDLWFGELFNLVK